MGSLLGPQITDNLTLISQNSYVNMTGILPIKDGM